MESSPSSDLVRLAEKLDRILHKINPTETLNLQKASCHAFQFYSDLSQVPVSAVSDYVEKIAHESPQECDITVMAQVKSLQGPLCLCLLRAIKSHLEKNEKGVLKQLTKKKLASFNKIMGQISPNYAYDSTKDKASALFSLNVMLGDELKTYKKEKVDPSYEKLLDQLEALLSILTLK